MAGASFNPAERRDHDGKWTDGGAAGAVGDALKLAGRIKLGPGERFGGSARVHDGNGDHSIVMARIDTSSGPVLRFGVVHPEDTGSWRAENKGATVEFDAAGAERLRETLRSAAAQGKKNIADYRAELRAAHKAQLPDEQWPQAEAEISSGVIHASRWGDLHWSLVREEGPDYSVGGADLGPGGSWALNLSPVPPGSTAARDPFNADKASTINQLDKALGDLIAAPAVQAAAGMDTHPGGEQLKHYWLHGEGAAKWSTWTELYHHLVKYLSPEMAKRTAAEWFHERYGIWPGDQKNLDKHGGKRG